jgi:2-polyprenyl-6-methoxyphenol hydroxylase-like FAD-dependent oxidoreductase
MSEPASVDAVVIGAGPAGSTTAGQLARLGYRVVLFHRARGQPGGLPRWETVSPITLRLIHTYHPDAHSSLQASLVPVTVQRHWFPVALPGRDAQSDQAILLDRSLLDEELRRSALAAGATVAGAPVESARISRAGDGWEVVATDSRIWRARFLVDAAGRRSFLNRQRIFLGTRTLAIETWWSGLSMAKRSTCLEALPSAWLWAASDDSSLVLLIAFVSKDRFPGGKAGIAARVRDLLEQSKLAAANAAIKMEVPPRVREATASSAVDHIGSSYVRVGDASLALDPIASQGCQQALVSGFQGAAVVHTCLSSPTAYPLAEKFVAARLQETIALHVRHTREAYRQQSRFQTAFWSSRYLSDPSSPIALENGNRLVPNEADPAEWIELSPSIQICDTAALLGNVIRCVPAVWHPSWTRPVAYFGSQSAVDLIKGLRGPIAVSKLVEFWSKQSGFTLETARELFNRLWQMGFFLPANKPVGGTI